MPLYVEMPLSSRVNGFMRDGFIDASRVIAVRGADGESSDTVVILDATGGSTLSLATSLSVSEVLSKVRGQ